MTSVNPVVSAASAILAHVPGLVEHGSKPSREIRLKPEVAADIADALRSFEDAVAYAPNRAFIGRLHPRQMPERPWTTSQPMGTEERSSRRGEMMPEEEFLGLLAICDEFGLITLDEAVAATAFEAWTNHPLAAHVDLEKIERAVGDVGAGRDGALSLRLRDGSLAALMVPGHSEDDDLAAHILLENLACKATGTLAMLHLVNTMDGPPDSIDYVISCSEEAVGDRYQRGGGNMAKAVAEAAGLLGASGCDVKNFCAAPIPAIVVAASLVDSGVFSRVAVVGGGSLPKLGMKFQGHIRNEMPLLEDVLGGSALLVESDDAKSPIVKLDAVGRHPVSAGGSGPQIMKALVNGPLDRVGLKMLDVDAYATELHNPELTEPQGSGNVPERNYRVIAALAVQRGELSRESMGEFVKTRGMPGFAPTQGHLASALCYLPHALDGLTEGEDQRVQMIAKGSLFLGQMTQASDGMSVLLERNRTRN